MLHVSLLGEQAKPERQGSDNDPSARRDLPCNLPGRGTDQLGGSARAVPLRFSVWCGGSSAVALLAFVLRGGDL